MNILEAYDLTGSLRDAAELAGCSHHTVARYVAGRERGRAPGVAARRPGVIDEFLPKLEELVERSKGKIRADKAHEKIAAMGYAGSERTTRRAVAGLKAAWQAGRRRVHRPWVPEPGMWAQYDFGDGPVIGTTATVLFCLWLAWSRFRVVVAAAGQDAGRAWPGRSTWRCAGLGGVPTYLLTDNEKTVTVEHVAGIPVRNPAAVELGRHYGLTVATCVPYDPASKGGSESTVKVAKADLVPADANLLAGVRQLRGAGGGVPGVLRRRSTPGRTGSPGGRRRRCWPRSGPGCTRSRRRRSPPRSGVTRTVDALSLVTFEGGQYSVPHQLAGQVGVGAPARRAGGDRPRRPRRARRGGPAPGDHAGQPAGRRRALPAGAARRAEPHAEGPHRRRGAVPGASATAPAQWLAEAAAAGARRVRAKMAARGPAGRPARRRRGGPGAGPGRRGGPVRRRRPGRDPGPPGRRSRRRSHAGPASSTRWPRAPAGGHATAGRRQPDDAAPAA